MGMSDENILIERLAIEDVFARYAHTADGYDADGWVECYTEDGIFEVETDGNRIQFVGRLDYRILSMRTSVCSLVPGTS
ncbi:MAG TPA: hypothetical protein EYM89_04395 [Candidatus Marinimicrobia bacterium]|nr:hypothetical protein [Candidatus Neomarinimicrobiota bacterium]